MWSSHTCEKLEKGSVAWSSVRAAKETCMSHVWQSFGLCFLFKKEPVWLLRPKSPASPQGLSAFGRQGHSSALCHAHPGVPESPSLLPAGARSCYRQCTDFVHVCKEATCHLTGPATRDECAPPVAHEVRQGLRLRAASCSLLGAASCLLKALLLSAKEF